MQFTIYMANALNPPSTTATVPVTKLANIPKNHTKRELTNGYKIRRGAIDHNIPLITNARLASAFIEAFCEMKLEDIQIKSWQEYK